MTTFPGSPKLLKGGIVQVDPDSGAVLGSIALQYNPETLSRSLQVQAITPAQGDFSQALRIKGPPIETFKLEAVIDAYDQLETPDQHPTAVQVGIHPQLAALESLIYPASADLLSNNALASSGMLEIIPMQAPYTIFVWSASRVVPVRITDLSITEEAFDPTLNPIRAKISLGLRVLSIDDLYFTDKGGSLYMAYQQQKETFARLYQGGTFSTLGISGIS